MVIDTSAVVAILLDEPERIHFVDLIEKDDCRLISAASLVEMTIVIEGRFREPGRVRLQRVIETASVAIVPVSVHHAELARDAFRRFGKGRHPAALNYGDCFSYALAKASGEPLLFKGNDFARTDIVAAA
jgi:ribonuclease VapC